MRALIQIVIVLLIAVALGVVFQQGNGKLIITFAGWRVDMALWVGFLILMVLVSVLYYAIKIIHQILFLPRDLKAYVKRYQQRRDEVLKNEITLTQNTLEQATISWQEAQKLWEKLPKPVRYQDPILVAFANILCEKAPPLVAEPFIRKNLDRHWQDALAELYSRVELPDLKQQLIRAEKWLPKHADSPGLLFTLGVLCEKLTLWGKAQSYFEESLQLKPLPQTHAKLGELLTQQNKPLAASAHFQKGLKLELEK